MNGIYGIDQLTMKLITNWIDMSSGNFLVKLDPYRDPKNDPKNFRTQWFDDDGDLKPCIHKALQALLKEKKYQWFADCQIASFLGGVKFATSIGEPDIYYWKR